MFEGKIYIRLGFRPEKSFQPKSVFGQRFSAEKSFGARVFSSGGKDADFRMFFIPKNYINVIYII